MFEGLAIFLIVLLLVTVVGHLLWLCLAALIRLFTGQSSKRRDDDSWYDDEAITARKLEQLYRNGQIDQPSFQKVLNAMYGHATPPPLASRLVQLAKNGGATSFPPIQNPNFSQEIIEKNGDASSFAPGKIPREVSELASPTPPPLAPPPLPIAQLAAPMLPPPLPPRKIPAPIAPLPPPPPRKPFSEILKHFMEEEGERWERGFCEVEAEEEASVRRAGRWEVEAERAE